MDFLILFYFFSCIVGVFYLVDTFDKILESKIVKVYHIIIAIILLPSTIIVSIIAVIYEIGKKISSMKLFSKLINTMNKTAINLNKKK